MGSVRVGIIGVGNIASMLVQSIEYYRRTGSSEGLIHEVIGPYRITDLEIVYAVDVSRHKVGKDLAEAIFAKPNITPRIVDLKPLGVKVRMGRILDGVAPHMVEDFEPADLPEPSMEDIVRELRELKVDVLVNLLPVGSSEATRFYARAAAEAGVAFVNGIPEFIASSEEYCSLFREHGAVLLGDDIKGQLGATIVNRALASLIANRGARLIEGYQLNVGGNTDFKNMVDHTRLHSKKISKTKAVITTQDNYEELWRKVYAGPSGYIEFLGNTKIAYMYMRAKAFAGSDVLIEVKLTVDDKAMATPVLVDTLRLAKVLKDHGLSGCIDWASAFYFKHPPKPVKSDYQALQEMYRRLDELGEPIYPKRTNLY